MNTPLEHILIEAAARGDAAGVSQALANGADSRAKGSHGHTALMRAAMGGHEECVGLLRGRPGTFQSVADVLGMKLCGLGLGDGRSRCVDLIMESIMESPASDGDACAAQREALRFCMERCDWERATFYGAMVLAASVGPAGVGAPRLLVRLMGRDSRLRSEALGRALLAGQSCVDRDLWQARRAGAGFFERAWQTKADRAMAAVAAQWEAAQIKAAACLVSPARARAASL